MPNSRIELRVRPAFRFLASLIAILGCVSLGHIWYYGVSDIPEVVIGTIALYTVLGAHIALFGEATEPENLARGPAAAGLNQDVGWLLNEFSLRTLTFYVAFTGFCAAFLYLSHRAGILDL